MKVNTLLVSNEGYCIFNVKNSEIRVDYLLNLHVDRGQENTVIFRNPKLKLLFAFGAFTYIIAVGDSVY